ncbi:adenylate/guanylate cyclase domain-containing protein [Aggregicoccus sp. 17bor-14]|uniref:adenylate/guanylate cyclase domain-containing protein n=1 Tax=Myxococcaceae TaxID=31 RepID=UPI00129C463F|nr:MULTISPECIES: adenylate/guanylate cyclase domain-containing protein [Myxococcaceae]MBF5043591.1 adenylate/guanylate cyclase domain-containing protein [Simulacricoccus sp. 17bor-14]MRI89350.1 adenylate/guanylate cyclase domain-containing protein [Aggregicoccus sp. 17bor-14]
MDAEPSAEPSLEELRLLRTLHRTVDDLLEESLKARETLAQTFRRLFPPLLQLLGARAVAVSTRNEELSEQTFHAGDWGGQHPGALLLAAPGARRHGPDTLYTQALDVVGTAVGSIGVLFPGDHEAPLAAARLARAVDTVAEQLDTVLCLVHTASEKHQLILECNAHLGNPVFEAGMDQAVLALSQRVNLPGFLLLYRDAVRPGLLHYRTYRRGHLEHESGERPSQALERAIAARGPELIGRAASAGSGLREVLGPVRTTEAVLISGAANASYDPLGKIVVWSDEGFSAYTLDLIRVLASTLSQRLLDYNRERIHLSQFFSAGVIDQLLADPDYAQLLRAQDQEVGILFADINGFTRMCEQGFESPKSIGRFVDEWSARAVDCIWAHGGVFDKMVGDCVIGLFGPPFFKGSRLERAEGAVRAAQDIARYTETLSAREEVARICRGVGLPGLGVAIGVNLAHAHCGLYGPNQQYTAFSSGMNQTARLQSLGGFRETLLMASVREVLAGSEDPALRALRFGPLTETPVKNVAQPLRHYRLL